MQHSSMNYRALLHRPVQNHGTVPCRTTTPKPAGPHHSARLLHLTLHGHCTMPHKAPVMQRRVTAQCHEEPQHGAGQGHCSVQCWITVQGPLGHCTLPFKCLKYTISSCNTQTRSQKQVLESPT